MLFFRYIFLFIQRNYKYVNYQFTFSNIYVLFRLFMYIFYFPYIFAIQNPLYRFFGKGGLSILSYSYGCRIYSYYLLSFWKYGKYFSVCMPAVFKIQGTVQLFFQRLFSFLILKQGQNIGMSTDQNITLNRMYFHHMAQLTNDLDIHRFGRGQNTCTATNGARRKLR